MKKTLFLLAFTVFAVAVSNVGYAEGPPKTEKSFVIAPVPAVAGMAMVIPMALAMDHSLIFDVPAVINEKEIVVKTPTIPRFTAPRGIPEQVGGLTPTWTETTLILSNFLTKLQLPDRLTTYAGPHCNPCWLIKTLDHLSAYAGPPYHDPGWLV